MTDQTFLIASTLGGVFIGFCWRYVGRIASLFGAGER